MAEGKNVVLEINIIEQSIQRIKQELDQFDDILKRAESGHASVSFLNEKYHKIIISTKDLSKHLKDLRSASHAPGVEDETRGRARNLHEQAMTQTSRVQRIGHKTQQVSEALARSAAAANMGQGTGFAGNALVNLDGDSRSLGQQQQQQTVLQMQDDEQMAREMENLEQDIVTVNELFSTLATFVHDQGEMVDSIEAHTDAAYVQVQSGVNHLQTAVQHKKSARRRKCICAIIFLVVITVVGLIIGLSFKNN